MCVSVTRTQVRPPPALPLPGLLQVLTHHAEQVPAVGTVWWERLHAGEVSCAQSCGGRLSSCSAVRGALSLCGAPRGPVHGVLVCSAPWTKPLCHGFRLRCCRAPV